MRVRSLPQPESTRPVPTHRRPGFRARGRLAAAALLAASLLLPCVTLAAQTSSAPPAAPAQKPAAITPRTHRRTHRAGAQPATPPAQAETPAQPKPPDWPANEQPAKASVVWDSHGLRITASNSSLAQILRDVTAKTGATLEGMGQDERIFGAYGPGPARDVLSQLLDGSGYNVLMIGDQGQGTPRRIVLSARPAGTAQPPGNPGASNNEETEAEPQPQAEPQPAPAAREVLPPSSPIRTPQQILQDIQARQQTQEQHQQNPQN